MPQCPNCHSHQVITKNYARKVGRTLGTAGGIAAGVSATLRGARYGSTVACIAGPPGRVIGGMTGAILGTLLWGVMAGKAGATLGDVVDDHLLDNHTCQRCGHRFSQPSDTVTLEGVFTRSPSSDPFDEDMPGYPSSH